MTKSNLLNQDIQDVLNENELYKWIMIASIVLVFILCIVLFIVIEDKKELKEQIEMLATSNQSLKDNMLIS